MEYLRYCVGIYEWVWVIFRVCLLRWKRRGSIAISGVLSSIYLSVLKRTSWYFESILLWEIALVFKSEYELFLGYVYFHWRKEYFWCIIVFIRHIRRAMWKRTSWYFWEYLSFLLWEIALVFTSEYEPFLGYVYFLGRVRGSAAIFGGQWKRHYDSLSMTGWK